MARRPAIEAEELFETADRLQAEGKAVTAVALLDALGGGSLRTIYKLLEEWRQRRPALVINSTEEIPAGVQSAFASAWRLATQEAGRQVAAVKEKALGEVSEALKQFHEALDAIGKLEAEGEADAQQIDSLKERVADLEARLQKSTSENAAHKATAEQLNRQVTSQEAELQRFHMTAEAERQRHREEVNELAAAAHKSQEAVNKEIASLKESLTTCQNKLELAQIERDEARMKADIVASDKVKIEQLADFARKEKEQALQEAAHARGQIEALKGENSELMAKLADRGKLVKP